MPKTAPPVIPANVPMPVLEVLDPEAIIVENIRDAEPDQQLIDSVREKWVESPVGVLRTPAGGHDSLGGLRRPAGLANGVAEDGFVGVGCGLSGPDLLDPLAELG